MKFRDRLNAIARVARNPEILEKLESGGGRNFGVPNQWSQSVYGPSSPLQPLTTARDVEIPRSIDYPIAVNSMLTPRTGYSNGGIPLRSFGDMATAYESVAEVRAPVSLLHRELSAFRPRLLDRNGNEVRDHDFSWICSLPDGETPFSVWMTRFLKSTKTYDAPAIYWERDNSNQICGMHYIDGSTLFAIVNEYGKTPKSEFIDGYVRRVAAQGVSPISHIVNNATMGPQNVQQFITQYTERRRDGLSVPDKIPAYTQVIKGTPFSWWSADDIWYMPQSPRTNAPYGESFIEASWTWIMIIANIQAFELAHYRTGNMPEGFVTVAEKFFATTDEVMNAEDIFNARMTSNPVTERNRIRVFPEGTTFTPTKKPDFPEELYQRAFENILNQFGMPKAEFGDIPGGGLGGAGFKQGSATELSRNTLNPHRVFISLPFNYMLEQNGVDDVTFALDYPIVEIDISKLKASVYEGMAHGTLTLNDGLGQLNLAPIGNPKDPNNIANKHLIVSGANIFVIEDMPVQNGLAIPTLPPKDQTGGQPVGPETVAKQAGAEHTPEDFKTLETIIKNLLEKGTLDSKTFSIPSEKVFQKVNPDVADQPRDEKGQWTAEGDGGADNPESKQDGMSRKEFEGAFKVQADSNTYNTANKILDSTTGLQDFVKGLGAPDGSEIIARMESDNVISVSIHNDKYSMPLLNSAGVLSKHCGTCEEDDEYFGAPISREVELDFPKDRHANGIEIVAATPEGLPPKPVLWKPEGVESPNLVQYIGGPQYKREEAAYLLDRSLGFYLVPVAWVASSYGEEGAAIWYTDNLQKPYADVTQYASEWLEKAAVFDYIISQTDRGYKHNFGTHPDDPTRPILFDNGLSFPVNESIYCKSVFCTTMVNKPLTVLPVLRRVLYDLSTWADIRQLVGKEATAKAIVCLQRLLDKKMITEYSHGSET